MKESEKTAMKCDGTFEAGVAASAAYQALEVARRKLAEAAHNGNGTPESKEMYKKIGEIQSMLAFF